MRTHWHRIVCGVAVLLGGCMPNEYDRGRSFFSGDPGVIAPPPPTNFPQASLEVASRVDSLGRQILAANPQFDQTGFKPLFLTIGVPAVTVFHQGPGVLFVSEGLVRRCATDAELAAVLCTEMGRMISEREAQLPASVRRPDREPPADPGFRSDVAGGSGFADQTRLAELGKFERSRPPGGRFAPPPPPPDPNLLAQGYLAKAGYSPEELTKVTPLLREAQANPTYEKQLTSGTKPPPSAAKQAPPPPSVQAQPQPGQQPAAAVQPASAPGQQQAPAQQPPPPPSAGRF